MVNDEFINLHGKRSRRIRIFQSTTKIEFTSKLNGFHEKHTNELREEGFEGSRSTVSPYGIIVEKGFLLILDYLKKAI